MNSIVKLICLLCLHSMFVKGTFEAPGQCIFAKEAGKTCYLGLPQRASNTCRRLRAKELAQKRVFYKITGPKDKFPFPHIDHPMKTTIGYFQNETFHSYWSYLYFKVGYTSRSKAIKALKSKYGKAVFTSFGNYTKLAKEFEDAYLRAAHHNTHFKYASRRYRYFTDLMKNERFMEDKYFEQLRLAGSNVMALRRVTLEGKSGTNYYDLKKRLNPNFDWVNQVLSSTGDIDIEESIKRNKVYVVDYSDLEDIKHMPDSLAKYIPHKIMRNNPAHIGIFAVDHEKKLRIVAIQQGTTQAGQVYTPCDGLQWQIVKTEFEISDAFYGSVVEHLLKTHYKMEPICLSLHRHLSKHHPLHQILQYHCRGLIPLNAFSILLLQTSPQSLRTVFSRGNKGAMQLLLKEYPKMVWNDVDLEVNLKKRGMNDKEMLPFYPYRDDGRLMNRVLREFANQLIALYYNHDYHVRRDYELQSMIGELAQRRGTKHANRISKVKGLPSSFRTRRQLSNFVRQVLWIVVQHSAFSYSTGDYSQSPMAPSKLYDSQRVGANLNFVQMLPGPLNSIMQAAIASAVGTYRYDSMFGYWKNVKSSKLSYLVKEAHKELGIVQHRINARNKKRYERGWLTNPYMMRDWMPSSIST